MNLVAATPKEPERLTRFQTLQAGQYWRAKEAICEEGIDAGEVLLIRSLKWVDEAVHTVELRPHPGKIGTSATIEYVDEYGQAQTRHMRYVAHRFLLTEFLSRFEHEPNCQAVRAAEVQKVHEQVAALQGELLEGQTNPAVLDGIVRAALTDETTAEPGTLDDAPSAHASDARSLVTGSVTSILGAGVTKESVSALRAAAQREHQIATIKAKWIQEKTQDIASTLQALAPYYEEQAAAALAQTEDVRAYVTKLMNGIESLDLYVGKGVEVTTIRQGQDAPDSEPLTFVQRKLLMDEELAVWVDVDESFDFRDEEKFFAALREHDGLVDQIFPTPRCMLVMATTRRFIDYGDSWTNKANNERNQEVFLLIRNGQNIYRVFSPVESHLGSERLFPTRTEHDALFRGLDGSQIKLEDVAYTDSLAAHERSALHYKRVLLLACGLDHRLGLFGRFYEGPADFRFMSLAFQAQYCRFLSDDDADAMLAAQARPSVWEWVGHVNNHLQSGSVVFGLWDEVMNPDTAPAACKADWRGDMMTRQYRATEPSGVAIAFQDGASICANVRVEGRTAKGEDRTFLCKVKLTKFRRGSWNAGLFGYLCLDVVNPNELREYIYNRAARANHIDYIRLFKRALAYVEAMRKDEEPTRQKLLDALVEGGVADGKQACDIVDKAVTAWRAANRGANLPCVTRDMAPKVWEALLNQMHALSNSGDQTLEAVQALARERGYDLLRVAVSGKSQWVMYVAPNPAERDDRVEPHAWVHRIALKKTRRGDLVEASSRWVRLPKHNAKEVTLRQWPQALPWEDATSHFTSLEQKQHTFEGVQNLDSVSDLVCSLGDYDDHRRRWERCRQRLNEKGRMVQEPSFVVPIGIVQHRPDAELRFLAIRAPAVAILAKKAPTPEAKQQLEDTFANLYSNKSYARRLFKRVATEAYPWELVEMDMASIPEGEYPYARSIVRDRISGLASPLLSKWFDSWKIRNATGAYWIHPTLLNDEGRLALDTVFGIQEPEDFEPVEIFTVTGSLSRNDRKWAWVEFRPPGTRMDDLMRGARMQSRAVMSIGTYYTLSDARAAVLEKNPEATRWSGEELGLPDGVERWLKKDV